MRLRGMRIAIYQGPGASGDVPANLATICGVAGAQPRPRARGC